MPAKQKSLRAKPQVVPRQPSRGVYQSNPFCVPLRQMYERVSSSNATTWTQIENDFLRTMSSFDSGIPQDATQFTNPDGTTQLSAALQNGKGDWFNDLIADLLTRCSGIEKLYVRRGVHGLIVPSMNLDGVYPGDPDREIELLLEAKMMGTPKHANSPRQETRGRRGSADMDKRVRELAFKAVDLKGEAARRLAMIGQPAVASGAGGGDLSTWLHSNRPKIFFLMAVRVLDDTDFRATIRWVETAAQALDAVGIYCYEPVAGSLTQYRRRAVPAAYELERVLWRACQELRMLRTSPPPPIPAEVPPSPAVEAQAAQREGSSRP